MRSRASLPGLRQSALTEGPLDVLQFLDFDVSEDAHGTVAWEAMASPLPQHNMALLAELTGLLQRLHAAHGPPGPLDEQHGWDCDLHVASDQGTPLAWQWQGQQIQWTWPDASMPDTRLTVSLSLSGHAAFTHTLEQEITDP